MWFMQNAMAKPDNAGAGSYDYMHLFGLVALGYMWCRIAEAAIAKNANGSAQRMNAKLVTARSFMERMLPETATRLARIQAGAGSTMELPGRGDLGHVAARPRERGDSCDTSFISFSGFTLARICAAYLCARRCYAGASRRCGVIAAAAMS